ncbi:hypothetical protein [Sphingosinicella sp. BN140058]|uniref:hypothetical protein n=1 Tax=Sphingosinicella sp. BN140058 TaxID=1892855 RepID=UPI0013EC81FB|nr:hypothetical protein [Sphingosinicella sp. BN140058]
MSERVPTEDPAPDRNAKSGDMGKGSLEQSMKGDRNEAVSTDGPKKVPISGNK